jgi:hypothetical protein
MSEKFRKYYDIEYSAQAMGYSVQRVYLDEIGEDDFSEEALESAKEEIRMNPDCEGDLYGEWEMTDDSINVMEYTEDDNSWTCCICDTLFIGGYGNNPDPVKKNLKGEHIKQWDPNDPDGYDPRCCDSCNTNVIIPARIKQATEINSNG